MFAAELAGDRCPACELPRATIEILRDRADRYPHHAAALLDVIDELAPPTRPEPVP